MDKLEYIRLLNEASINDLTKFRPVSQQKPTTRGRPPKYYHPLLAKEKHLESVVRKILPKEIADSVCKKGSRLAHLYGLPKTHKTTLTMRPILSPTGTYNYALAKWLDEKLKPLSNNEYTISDVFNFAEEIKHLKLDGNVFLVSYDVTALFTNVPLDETIHIPADKAFKDNWFNKTYNMNISKDDLIELLSVATKNQLFQFNGNLYEQVDGVAMGSPLGPLMANAFMCSVEEKLAGENKLPSFYKRYVDDTLALVRNLSDATDLLTCLNEAHPSIQFTMEVATNDRLPFIGMEIIKTDGSLETCIYRKQTNKGLLLHYQSHVDSRYKRSLLRTMLDRAKRLSSTQDFLLQECKTLKEIFLKLKYPEKFINSAINRLQYPTDPVQTPSDRPVRITLPFKDQKSADVVRRQLGDLGTKINQELQPVFTSKKIADHLRVTEEKPPLINQQSVVYEFTCDLCDTNYIGYTCRHKHSVIGKHLRDAHGLTPNNLIRNFKVIKKCRDKFECLVYEMLWIKNKRPKLNTQADSIRAKLFT